MPIYEFYCSKCHTIYSFWSKTVNTEKIPGCPKESRHRLQRQVSSFAVVSDSKTGGEDRLDDLPIDEAKMAQAMESLASEAEGIDEEDPRAAARLMRKLSEQTGIEYGESMEAALQRLEAGEDPDAVEADMGDLMEGDEEPFILSGSQRGGRKKKAPPPKRDDTLYEM